MATHWHLSAVVFLLYWVYSSLSHVCFGYWISGLILHLPAVACVLAIVCMGLAGSAVL